MCKFKLNSKYLEQLCRHKRLHTFANETGLDSRFKIQDFKKVLESRRLDSRLKILKKVLESRGLGFKTQDFKKFLNPES